MNYESKPPHVDGAPMGDPNERPDGLDEWLESQDSHEYPSRRRFAAYIRRLEADNAWRRTTLTNRDKTVSDMSKEIASVKTERDEARINLRALETSAAAKPVDGPFRTSRFREINRDQATILADLREWMSVAGMAVDKDVDMMFVLKSRFDAMEAAVALERSLAKENADTADAAEACNQKLSDEMQKARILLDLIGHHDTAEARATEKIDKLLRDAIAHAKVSE